MRQAVAFPRGARALERRLGSCGTRAQLLCWHVGSSRAGDGPRGPGTGRGFLNHSATREVPAGFSVPPAVQPGVPPIESIFCPIKKRSPGVGGVGSGIYSTLLFFSWTDFFEGLSLF